MKQMSAGLRTLTIITDHNNQRSFSQYAHGRPTSNFKPQTSNFPRQRSQAKATNIKQLYLRP
jgi:hypothetical protein